MLFLPCYLAIVMQTFLGLYVSTIQLFYKKYQIGDTICIAMSTFWIRAEQMQSIFTLTTLTNDKISELPLLFQNVKMMVNDSFNLCSWKIKLYKYG